MTTGQSTPNQHYIKERAAVIAESAALALPDAAYRIVHYNYFNRRLGPRTHCEPIAIAELARGEPEPDQQLWLRAAAKMFNAAHVPGDAYLSDPIAATPIIAAFKRHHPGFSEESYSRAICYGIWVMR